MAKSNIDKKRYPVGDYEGQFVFNGFVSMDEKNRKRLEIFFSDKQIETLVNDIVDNAITDFLVFIENLDNAKFQKYYEELTSDEKLSVV